MKSSTLYVLNEIIKNGGDRERALVAAAISEMIETTSSIDERQAKSLKERITLVAILLSTWRNSPGATELEWRFRYESMLTAVATWLNGCK